MPTSLTIAIFVFGAVLLLVALVGGKFKLFGTEVSGEVSNSGIRWVAGLLGFVLLSLALYGFKPGPPDIKPDVTPHSPPVPPAAGAATLSDREAVDVPWFGRVIVGESCAQPGLVHSPFPNIWNCDATGKLRLQCQNGMVRAEGCDHGCLQHGNGIADECRP